MTGKVLVVRLQILATEEAEAKHCQKPAFSAMNEAVTFHRDFQKRQQNVHFVAFHRLQLILV